MYADPPFNTGKTQTRRSLVTTPSDEGDRTGFGGRRYATKLLAESSYKDHFEDYLGFLGPRLEEIRRVLHPTGTLYLHLDYREAHYVKLLLDELFGRECFLNELIWAYDYGAKAKGRWPQKHDTILVYVKDPRQYYFDSEGVDREPYMAPGLVTPEKVKRGKLPVSVMWHTIVSPTGTREDGLSDAEAGGSAAPLRAGQHPPRGPVPGPVRGLRHARRGGPQAGPPLPADRREPGGRPGHARAPCLSGSSRSAPAA